MIERPDATALLAGPLGQWLAEQDAVRDETRAKANRRMYWGIGFAAAVAFIVIIAGGPIPLAGQLGFFIGAGGFAWSEWTKRPVLTRIKGGINGAIAKALGLDYSTSVSDMRQFDCARAFGLVPTFDKSVLEDQWSGDLRGLPFSLHEAKLTEERGSGKSRRTVTVFAGSLMAIGFARSFNGTTLIERKGSHKSFLGLFGADKDTITVNGTRLDRIDTVDPAFDDMFSVWSNDQVEGHYLINPSYVEKLVAVETAFSGDKVRALFNAGTLLIVLENGDLFESGSLDSGDDHRLLEQSITQFGTLADLAIQLNERPR